MLLFIYKLEEAKLLRAQGQHDMAINLADYISQNQRLKEGASDVFRLVGKWLAETRSSKLVLHHNDQDYICSSIAQSCLKWILVLSKSLGCITKLT